MMIHDWCSTPTRLQTIEERAAVVERDPTFLIVDDDSLQNMVCAYKKEVGWWGAAHRFCKPLRNVAFVDEDSPLDRS